MPWRDGGRGKQKAAPWRSRATHAVDDVSQLGGEAVEVRYYCAFGLSAAEGIYLFDQAVARTGTRYHAELIGSQRFPVFVVRVPADRAEEIRAIVARLQQR